MANPTSVIGTAVSGGIKLGGKGTKAAWQNKHGLYHFGSTVNQQTKEGRSLGASVLRGAATYGAYTVAPHVMYGKQFADMAVQGAGAAVEFRRQKAHQLASENRYAKIGGNFQDSQSAHTMRQAATQQIQANKMNARSALGGEARIFSGKRINQHTRPYA